jgi:glycosyltransferase involved in cell wall biosynthesis
VIQGVKHRILVLADVCNPEWPSLPIVGYKYAKALADHADVTVVTQVRNRPNLEKHGFGKARVDYLDTEGIAEPLARLANVLRGGPGKGWTLQIAMDYPSYVWFERVAWQRYGDALRSGEFDFVHRITPMSPTLPSYLAKRSPVPFVLGPLNGNLPWPRQFRAELSREREWMSFVRGAYKWLPYTSSTYSRSSCILAAFQHTIRDLGPAVAGKTINFPEVGIDPELFSPGDRPTEGPVEVLYAGRLVPYKLPEVIIRAFGDSKILGAHRLTIVGDGPERPRLEALIDRLQLRDRVTLLGQRSQQEVASLMQRAHVFAFPSIRELGAGVVIEAMASGMACVVVDYGGPADLVAEDRGIKIPMGSLDELVHRFRSSLESLVSDRDRIARLGRVATTHALEKYSWDQKALKTLEIYSWIAGGKRGRKPDFWD